MTKGEEHLARIHLECGKIITERNKLKKLVIKLKAKLKNDKF